MLLSVRMLGKKNRSRYIYKQKVFVFSVSHMTWTVGRHAFITKLITFWGLELHAYNFYFYYYFHLNWALLLIFVSWFLLHISFYLSNYIYNGYFFSVPNMKIKLQIQTKIFFLSSLKYFKWLLTAAAQNFPSVSVFILFF